MENVLHFLEAIFHISSLILITVIVLKLMKHGPEFQRTEIGAKLFIAFGLVAIIADLLEPLKSKELFIFKIIFDFFFIYIGYNGLQNKKNEP